MKSLTNLALLALIVWGGYTAWHNPKVRSFVAEYISATKSDLSEVAGGTPIAFDFKSLGGSFSKLVSVGGSTATEIPGVVTPGPLAKIPVAGSSTQSSGTTTVSATSGAALTVKGIIAAGNAERAKTGAGALSESAKLNASALVKAADILKWQYFEHVAPDGTTVSKLVGDQGYEYIKIGENLALGDFASNADVVTAWMNSPGHRANILDAQFKEIGIGIAYGTYHGRTVYVAVQHFGRPQAACPKVDANLKAQVESGQAKLTQDANRLQQEKKDIDQGIAIGTDESLQIAAYNAGVEKYQADYAKIDELRLEYNAQVNVFNTCVTSTE